MAANYSQQVQQAQMPPAIDPSMQGAPGAPQMPMPGAGGPPALMGVQSQAPIPQPGMGPYGQPVNPALLASVMGLQSQQSQQGQVDRSRKLADSLRADSKDQLQGQQAGRVFKSAGLGNLAASLADSYGAMKLGQQADQRSQSMDAQRASAMGDYFKALTSGYQAPSQGGGSGGAGQ